MDDRLDRTALHDPVEHRRIAAVTLEKRRVPCCSPMSERKIVEDDDLGSRILQATNDVAADVAGASGDEHFSHSALPALGAPRRASYQDDKRSPLAPPNESS